MLPPVPKELKKKPADVSIDKHCDNCNGCPWELKKYMCGGKYVRNITMTQESAPSNFLLRHVTSLDLQVGASCQERT